MAIEQSNTPLEYRTLFPTPNGIEEVWLLDALIEILRVAPWLTPRLGGAGNTLANLSARRDHLLSTIPVEQHDAVIDLLGGDYERAGAVIGLGSDRSSRAMYRLRGLYWLALRYWWAQGRIHHTAVEAFGSALRQVARSPRSKAAHELDPILAALASAHEFDGVLAAMNLLLQSDHRALREAWQKGLQQPLNQPGSGTDPLPPPLPPNPKLPRGPRLRRKRGLRAMDRDEAIQRFTTPSNVRLLRHTPTADQLPTEPPDEFSKPVDLVLVPGLGTGQVPGRVAMYRARQAVWGGNPWNLSSHVETLPAATYGTVLRSLVEQLDRADQSDRVIIGLSTALLKAVSGRTTSGVLALCASLETIRLPCYGWILLGVGLGSRHTGERGPMARMMSQMRPPVTFAQHRPKQPAWSPPTMTSRSRYHEQSIACCAVMSSR